MCYGDSCFPEFFEENKEDRGKLKERFKSLLLKDDNEDIGQIGFTTFHQSFSYFKLEITLYLQRMFMGEHLDYLFESVIKDTF